MGRGREDLTCEDHDLIETNIAAVQVVPARKVLVQKGELVRHSTLLLEGFICRSIENRRGERQTVGIHVPGDFVDLDALQLKCINHDIVTIGAAKIAIYDHDTLTHLSERYPRLTKMLWLSTSLDATLHQEWIFRLGRFGAEARVARLFCELHARLEMVGLVRDDGFELPLTQVDMGEATGLTSVHVNRVLRSLRERNLLNFTNRRVSILNRNGLAALGEFNPHPLYASKSRVRSAEIANNAALNA